MEVDRLLNASKWRWLKSAEIFMLLRSHSRAVLPTLSEHTSVPASGDLFYINTEQFKRWKQDGHQYILRKSGKGVREDRDKYNDELDSVQCLYTHGGGQCFKCKSTGILSCGVCGYQVTPLTFHRRAY